MASGVLINDLIVIVIYLFQVMIIINDINIIFKIIYYLNLHGI